MAQAAAAPASPSNPLLRIKHRTSSNDTCALVQRNGNYHLELTHGDKTRITEGHLSTSKLYQIQLWLIDPQLEPLKQEQILFPLLSSEKDWLQLEIFRGNQTQNLIFPAVETRQPFENSLDPLVKWLDELPNSPGKQLTEDEGRTNCLPPGPVELKTRTSTVPKIAITNAASILGSDPPQVPLLMRYKATHFSERDVSRICIVVVSGGRYHMEKSSQSPGRDMKSDIYQGTLEPQAMQALHYLLNDYNFKRFRFDNMPTDSSLQMSGFKSLEIARDNTTQRLMFAEDLLTSSGNRAHTLGDNEKRILPIERWIEKNMQNVKDTPIPDGIATNCSAI